MTRELQGLHTIAMRVYQALVASGVKGTEFKHRFNDLQYELLRHVGVLFSTLEEPELAELRATGTTWCCRYGQDCYTHTQDDSSLRGNFSGFNCFNFSAKVKGLWLFGEVLHELRCLGCGPLCC